ncbi:MAG: hypothetical protein DRP08_03135 [Candidatus Aenigmatarchaeota archaeon]|nr:MAG: hypothetical protein DRP08_03135 [Candidatus Aenigmarchaeota archaeon]
MTEKYIAPTFGSEAFHCPHCGTYAHQSWYGIKTVPHLKTIENLSASFCARCKRHAIWYGDKMIYPAFSIAPLPVEDMPEDVKEDFIEARNIVNNSPRAAAALLRLALQKLMIYLGVKGRDLNEDIANLVKKGLPEKIQKALDAVRVIGNHAVHPGKIDLKDDTQTAIVLFELLNMIVEVMITQPQKVDEIYNKIPNSTKEAIKKRNGKI